MRVKYVVRSSIDQGLNFYSLQKIQTWLIVEKRLQSTGEEEGEEAPIRIESDSSATCRNLRLLNGYGDPDESPEREVASEMRA